VSIDGKATIRVFVAKNGQFFSSKKRSFFLLKAKFSIYYSKFVLDPPKKTRNLLQLHNPSLLHEDL